MTMLLSLDYSKFKRFSNIIDKISIKLISTFVNCEVPDVVPDRYGFEKLLKIYTGHSTHIQKIQILDNRKLLDTKLP